MNRPCSCNRVRIGFAYDASQCHDCWRWFHDDVFNRQYGGLGVKGPPQPGVLAPPMPSLLDMAKHAAQDLIQITKGILNRDPLLTEEKLKQERLDTCYKCEHYAQGRCSLCGCYMDLKTAIHVMKCPDNRWKR